MSVKYKKKRAVIALLLATLAALVAWWCWMRIAHPPADLSRLAPAFATALPTTRDRAAKAAAAGKARDYRAAVDAMAALTSDATLSDDQKQALIIALTEIRRKLAEVSSPNPGLFNRIDELILALMG